MTLWSASAILDATRGQLDGAADWQASGISIDSRSLARGELFIAIKGEHHDGHAYLDAAAKAGAVAALVERKTEANLPQIIVDDALAALGQLAVAARDRSPARRIAITGSVGKTGTRHLIAGLLERHAPCHASLGNLNNHIGAPLSLARMPATARYGVFELGMNHAGEIAALSPMVAPDIAIITRIAESHIGHFDGLGAIAKAKAEIFTGLNAGGGAILNADDPFCPMLTEAARAAGADRVITVGSAAEADHRITGLRRHPDGLEVEAVISGEALRFQLAMTASHAALTAMFGLAVAELDGLDRTTSLDALAMIGDLAGRGQQHKINLGDGRRFTLIDDSYNASPASMTAAIRDLADSPLAGRRVAILADMLELGDRRDELHCALAGPLTATPPGLLICFGEGMKALADSLPKGLIATVHTTDADAATDAALGLIEDGDVVLVKGSNGMNTARLARQLMAASTNGENHAA